MNISVKLLSGDLITFTLEKYSDIVVKNRIRQILNDYCSDIVLHNVESDNDEENEKGDNEGIDGDEKEEEKEEKKDEKEKKEEKMLLALILPAHPDSDEFTGFLEQVSAFSHDPFNWKKSFIELRHHRVLRPSSEFMGLLAYFEQFPLFFKGDNPIRHDSVIHSESREAVSSHEREYNSGTAFDVMTSCLLKCHEEIAQHAVIWNGYRHLCEEMGKEKRQQVASTIATNLLQTFNSHCNAKYKEFGDFLFDNGTLQNSRILHVLGKIENASDPFVGLSSLIDVFDIDHVTKLDDRTLLHLIVTDCEIIQPNHLKAVVRHFIQHFERYPSVSYRRLVNDRLKSFDWSYD